jgi:hypothetical protein
MLYIKRSIRGLAAAPELYFYDDLAMENDGK